MSFVGTFRAALGRAGLASALLGGAGLAFAATPYDGVWEVSIIVESGGCDQGYMVPLQVSDGRVSYAGTFTATASGAVNARGTLSLRFTHDANTVAGTGTLAGRDGAGNWTSETLKCTGRWIARKAGG